MQNYTTVGIDEVGRGPLAGPVAVGVAVIPEGFDWSLLPGVTDSKQLTEKRREEIYEAARKLKASAELAYAVAMVSAKVIDRIGIVPAINLAMDRALKRIENSPIDWNTQNCNVLLDGGLKAPERFLHQETIIKGDSKEKVIGLASIVAKVTRDGYMLRRAKLAAYEPYGFAKHKGYGTKAHRAATATYGLSPEHRRSYCKNIKVL